MYFREVFLQNQGLTIKQYSFQKYFYLKAYKIILPIFKIVNILTYIFL